MPDVAELPGSAGLPGVGTVRRFGGAAFFRGAGLVGGVVGVGVAGWTGLVPVGIVVVVRGPGAAVVPGDEHGTSSGHTTPTEEPHPFAPTCGAPPDSPSGRTPGCVVLVTR